VRIRQRAENFSQPLEQEGAVISPLILIAVPNKLAHPLPILFLDLNEKVHAVQVDLAFRLPKSHEINAHDQRDKQTSVNSIPETYRHRAR
jgi:hypothetical protein